MEYGIALYSIHDVMKEGVPKAVDVAAELGYSFVEPCGSFTNKEDQLSLKASLEKNQLKCNSMHTIWQSLLPDQIGTTIDMYHTIGCDSFVVPVFFPNSKEEITEFLKTVNDAKKTLDSEGIKIYYHNHLHEVYENKFGITVLDALRDYTDINFEIDTYWAFEGYLQVLAGVKGHVGTAKDYEIRTEYVLEAAADVLKLMEQLKDRVNFIHLRDGDGYSTPMPLGRGIAPLEYIYTKARDLGFRVMYEGEPFGHGIEYAKISLEKMKSLEEKYLSAKAEG